MKKLILIVLLFIAGLTVKSQVWQADTLRYFKNVMDTTTTEPDTTIVNDMIITLSNGRINIRKWDANFNAIIIDTINVHVMGRGVYIVNCNIRTVASTNGKIYNMELHMGYFQNTLMSVGLSRNGQLFLYHIVNQLIDLNARAETYFRDWFRASLGR